MKTSMNHTYHALMQEERSKHGIAYRGEGKASPRAKVFAFFIVFACIGWLYVVFVSDAFVVRDISAGGLSNLTQLDVSREVFRSLDKRTVWRPWGPRHSWFIDKEMLTHDLEERLFAERVSVDNIQNNVLRLSIRERSKRVILHTGNGFLWADRSGVVTDELTPLELQDVRARLSRKRSSQLQDPEIFVLPAASEFAAGYIVASTNTMRMWIGLSDAFKSSGLNFIELEPPSVSSTRVTVKTAEGHRVFLDTQIPLKSQIDTYNAFLKMKPRPQVSEYVDVRVPGRIYYK